eukprot:Skav209342  [mRNA]  locus=scaffold241:431710:438587:- [translate_table: standard]
MVPSGALQRNDYADELRNLPQEPLPETTPPPGAVIRRPQNRPAAFAGSRFPAQLYPGHPHNFTPLRPVTVGFSALDRAVREVAWESRFDLMERRIEQLGVVGERRAIGVARPCPAL